MGAVLPDGDGAVRTSGAVATLPALLHCALQMCSDVVWGLSQWCHTCVQIHRLPLALLFPHPPHTSHHRHGGVGGILQCWVHLAQHVSKTTGAQRVPPAGTAGMASCFMHAARVIAATSTHVWRPSMYGGAGLAAQGSRRTPLLPRDDDKGSSALGGLGSRAQLM